MLPRTYDDQNCSVARALEVLGDRWTLLVIRDAFLGVRRFDDFQRDLGVARNVLSDRLQRLVDEGLLERVRYQERPERFEYRLSDKGIDLWPTIITLMITAHSLLSLIDYLSQPDCCCQQRADGDRIVRSLGEHDRRCHDGCDQELDLGVIGGEGVPDGTPLRCVVSRHRTGRRRPRRTSAPCTGPGRAWGR